VKRPRYRAPKLPIRTVTVRPLRGAVVYSRDVLGNYAALPEDVWSVVPVSPGIATAIKNGDLEKAEPGRDEIAVKPSSPPRPSEPPAPVKPPLQKTKAPAGRRKRGRTEYDVWGPMFGHLDTVVKEERGGAPFDSYVQAAHVGQGFLKDLAKIRRKEDKGTAIPTIDTIREKISNQRPDLVAGNCG
jgi:hypothetical protein